MATTFRALKFNVEIKLFKRTKMVPIRKFMRFFGAFAG